MKERKSGILLHITSLPSRFGIGDLGPEAFRFVDFLYDTKQRYWQILPLNPTDQKSDNSPYHSISAFAFNPLLISPEEMVKENLIKNTDIESIPDLIPWKVNYQEVISYKERLFQIAYNNFQILEIKSDYRQFCDENGSWLEDFALFVAIRRNYKGAIWSVWQEELRDRQSDMLHTIKQELEYEIEKVKFLQFIFFRQWKKLKAYCKEKSIRIIGDIPIYVTADSADCWTHPAIFKLNKKMKPYIVAGVPPDYFSKTGQLWGNPVYRWNVLKKSGYSWWIERIKHNMKLYDFVRIDHFRGFVSFWEVPAAQKTAINGRWIKAPANDFFHVLKKAIPSIEIIAEDLGYITPDVYEVMDHFSFPGMKVLQFAFNDNMPKNPYIPHNLVKNCILYTGTHDNNTSIGWFKQEADAEIKMNLNKYLGFEVTEDKLPWTLIRLAMMSIANTTIFPIQDILNLGEEHRMNIPGTMKNNWCWKLESGYLTDQLAKKLSEITEIFGRC